MENKKIKVVKWISYDEAEDMPNSIGGLGGFFNWETKGMRWKDYTDDFKEEVKPYAEALRKEIVSKKIRYTGEDHQDQNDGVPVFNDGTVGIFSFRAWGDLMAAIWSEEENMDYTYMDFYM